MSHDNAFLLLQIFRRRALPTLLRKLHIWKGLNQDQHRDLIEDLDQELWLDCLQHAELIISLPSRERHTRWFRLIEKQHYRLHTRSERVRAPDTALESLADSAPVGRDSEESSDFDPVQNWGSELQTPQRRFLRRLGASARYLKNGRLNCRESAERLGVRPHDLNDAWIGVAAELGYGDDFLAFWRRRLVEALLGLAADLLRDTYRIRVYDEARRRRPDPRGRLKRMRQLRAHLSWRPVPADLKHILTRYHSLSSPSGLDPREVLADAEFLAPADPSVKLWQFEAHLAARDLPQAVASIRAARHLAADPVRVRLARARILELLGREAAARRLLDRSPSKCRFDDRVESARERLRSSDARAHEPTRRPRVSG